MKKLLCLLCLWGLMAVSVQAAAIQSLGWWDEGALGSTHQFWDFTPGYVVVYPGDGASARPESVISPEPESVLATISPGVAYDGQGVFVGPYIYVNLELPNYNVLNPYKEIWVDIGDAVIYPGSIAISAAGNGLQTTDYHCEVLPGQGAAEFGVKIWPNPGIEKIGFMILGTNVPAVLDYIHVDTICIPEPATVCLMGIAALAFVRKPR